MSDDEARVFQIPLMIQQAVDQARRQMRDGALTMLRANPAMDPADREALRRIAAWPVPSRDIDPEELYRRARAVVETRYQPASTWEELSEAIGNLADLVGGGTLSGD